MFDVVCEVVQVVELIDVVVFDVDLIGCDVYLVVVLLQKCGVFLLFYIGYVMIVELYVLFFNVVVCIKLMLLDKFIW